MSKLLSSLQPLWDRRFLVVLLLGFASGFPFVMHGSVLTLWLRSEGLSRTSIGLIGAVTAVYSINWLWSPLIDRVRLPLLTRYFGQRRSWLLLCQSLLIGILLLMARGEPASSLGLIGLCALLIAIVSATQDMAIDSYRVLLFKPEESDKKLPFASAMATAGWYAGYSFIGGAVALALGGETLGFSWPEVYQVLAAITTLVLVLVLLVPEAEVESYAPSGQQTAKTRQNPVSVNNAPVQPPQVVPQSQTLAVWLHGIVIKPFTEFFNRCGLQLGVLILLFLFSFRLGEAMLGRMSLLFYSELGFTAEQLALYNKFLGGLSIAVFSLLGALINTRYGVMRGMLVGGIAMAAANLLYALMAVVGPVPWLFMLTLLIDNFCSAFASVAVIAFISHFTSRTFTGSQFALMSALSTFGRQTLSSGSGAIVDALGGNWPLFFVLTTVAVLPALVLLLWIGRLLKAKAV
jgi:MFS transporter, PAT family, beta-lactamase induction signal transducer AmpG